MAAAHVCAAHQLALNDANIMWVAHLDFQEIYPGYFQGLIQKQAGDFLSNRSQWQDPGLLVSATRALVNIWDWAVGMKLRSRVGSHDLASGSQIVQWLIIWALTLMHKDHI